MTIKCIYTELVNPPKEIISTGWAKASGYLTIGKCYHVFAIEYNRYNTDCAWYLICDDNYDDMGYNYPVFIPALYFQIVDDKKPESWISSLADYKYEGYAEVVPDKYEALVDGDPIIVSKFRALRYRIEDS